MKTPTIALIASVFIISSILPTVRAGVKGKRAQDRLSHTAQNNTYRPVLINNVFNYYGNNGDGSYNTFTPLNEGFEFSKGTNKTMVFEDGVVWGGFHKGRTTPKVDGSVYRHGLQAGPILTNGTATTDPVAADPADPRYHIYRVRPDISPHTPLDDAMTAKIQGTEWVYMIRYESVSIADIYNQYVNDWNNWPADEGAPFTDVNGNGTYEPLVDIPGRPGADQTLWYVANDMDTLRTALIGGSPPIGVEMQRTIWGFNRASALGQTIFQSTVLVNKSGAPIDSMFFVQWADPDVGDLNDDLVGCDTARSLGYAYNGQSSDAMYGTAVPACGFVFTQGPIVPGSANDTARFRSRLRPGFKNLKMSAFALSFNSLISLYQDPSPGAGGDIEWYWLMNGLNPNTGGPFTDPLTSKPTKFVCPGDPVTNSGWVDGAAGGIGAPGDRRMSMVTGPFTMASGDTQEVVVANMAGLGADYLSSISVLKAYADAIRTGSDAAGTLPPSDSVLIPTHISGGATCKFVIRVEHRELLKNHFYVIEGVDSINAARDPGITLRDSTDGRVLLLNHAMPDSLAQNVPETDGFRLLRGSFLSTFGCNGWSIPQGTRIWSSVGGNRYALEGFFGSIGNAHDFGTLNGFWTSTIQPRDVPGVLIKFAATDINGALLDANDTTASCAYRYLGGASDPPAHPEFAPYIIHTGPGFPFQDYQRSLPFAAYDVSVSPPRRLMVGFLENNVDSGSVNGRYWPPPMTENCSTTSPREWFFIYGEEYSVTPDPALEVNLLRGTLPMFWVGMPTTRGYVAFSAGNEFSISSGSLISSSDRWIFIVAGAMLGVPPGERPQAFAVYQNYPNPFNPSTTIAYKLPSASRVTLKVYNLLGQEVRTVIAGELRSAGPNTARWDGTNDDGRAVASGVYFYRLEVKPQGNALPAITQVKKMILLR